MFSDELMHKLGVLAGALMIGAGILFGVRMVSRAPALGGSPAAGTIQERGRDAQDLSSAAVTPTESRTGAASAPTEMPTVTPATPIAVGATAVLPGVLRDALTASGAQIVMLEPNDDDPDAELVFAYETGRRADRDAIFTEVYAVVGPFDAPTPSVRWSQVKRAWTGENRRYPTLAILTETVPALETLFGPVLHSTPLTFDSVEQIAAALSEGTVDLAVVPFDRIVPELAVFEVNDLNPLEQDDRFDLEKYPLVVTVSATQSDSAQNQQAAADFLAALPDTNRDPDKMTTVAMTGVTAMVRFTAARMDQRGYGWPAEEVGPELSRADITVISNEVPFVEGCETDMDPDNIIFCSKPEYVEALLAAGTDLVGLTGNHLNDYGPEGALQSLQIYEDAGLQVYGGGADKASAMQPLVVEHNGNRIAFLGANSYGPPEAWASDFLPGSAPFDLNIMSAMIRSLKEDGDADVVLAELQYQESYDTTPLPEQQADFRALVRAGADVVTGVQSHVAQAVEFLDGKLILYGLGNFFFDQMWNDNTREGLIAVHTIYDGRHISTRLLPTILYDYGQPRFTSPIDGARILKRVYEALPN